jgi:ABC-type transporter Mla MlaB component
MLRITIRNEAAATRFVIEGKLTGPWVAELRKCWQAATPAAPDSPRLPLLVDLSAMTLIDPGGKALLAEMHRQGRLG